MSKQFLAENFTFMKQFLDTALRENLKMKDVEIEEVNFDGIDTKYWVRALHSSLFERRLLGTSISYQQKSHPS